MTMITASRQWPLVSHLFPVGTVSLSMSMALEFFCSLVSLKPSSNDHVCSVSGQFSLTSMNSFPEYCPLLAAVFPDLLVYLLCRECSDHPSNLFSITAAFSGPSISYEARLWFAFIVSHKGLRISFISDFVVFSYLLMSIYFMLAIWSYSLAWEYCTIVASAELWFFY